MFRIPVIPKTKKTTSTINNIVFDPSLKGFCMHDVCNLKYVGKLECLSHKPSFLVLFTCDSMWFAWFFVDIYLAALCCLVSVVPNIVWLITFANFRNIETFDMKRQWWRQKFSAAIASVIMQVLSILKSIFEVNSNKGTDRLFLSIRVGKTKLKVEGPSSD